jgi:alanine racemase
MPDALAPRIEISGPALRHNIRGLRDRLGPGRKLAAVLKGNAYGHGRDLVARLVADEVDLLAVADPADALALASAAPGRVLCLGPAHGDLLEECIARGVRVTVSSRAQLDRLSHGATVHVLVDTGLHRLGVAPSDAAALCDAVRSAGAQLEGVFCMVARADAGDCDDVAREVELLTGLGLDGAHVHTGGSSVALERPDLAGDLGRAGLAVLGYHPRAEQRALVDLEPSLRLVAPIVETRTVGAGDRVGYQARPVEHDTVVATLPLGAAHGWHPAADARLEVLLNGQPCPFLCPPSLDYSLVDATAAPGAELGAEAVVLGGRPGTPTSVVDVAARLGVLVDHVVTPLAASITRHATG